MCYFMARFAVYFAMSAYSFHIEHEDQTFRSTHCVWDTGLKTVSPALLPLGSYDNYLYHH